MVTVGGVTSIVIVNNGKSEKFPTLSVTRNTTVPLSEAAFICSFVIVIVAVVPVTVASTPVEKSLLPIFTNCTVFTPLSFAASAIFLNVTVMSFLALENLVGNLPTIIESILSKSIALGAAKST